MSNASSYSYGKKQDIGGENFKAFDLGNGKEVCVTHNDWAWRK